MRAAARGETPLSANEHAFILAALREGQRVDGRQPDAYRRIRIRCGARYVRRL